MAFNHYSKVKRILDDRSDKWVIRRIDEPTQAKNFKGDVVKFDHYYRIYGEDGEAIKYCKFQQIELLSKSLKIPVEALNVIEV